jgi:hypothetical protein
VNQGGVAGLFPPGYSVHHLAGNVAEWCKAREEGQQRAQIVGGRYADSNKKKFTGDLPDTLPLWDTRPGYGFRGVVRPAQFFEELLPQ